MQLPKFHFISGLPRSGSTLLAAILRQNPRFHTGISSPLAQLFTGALDAISTRNESAVSLQDHQKERILKGLFLNAYDDELKQGQLVFDSSRLWASRLPALKQLFPASKVICCVRDLGWVMDSLESLVRRHPLSESALFSDPKERNTVYSRVHTLAQSDRLVGFSWHASKEAFYAPDTDHVLFVDYDLLVAEPGACVRLIYQFLEEPWFEHDFSRVDYDAPKFDERLGLQGMHRVEGQVQPRPRDSVLPPDLFAEYSAMSFWRNGPKGRAKVLTAAPGEHHTCQPSPRSEE